MPAVGADRDTEAEAETGAEADTDADEAWRDFMVSATVSRTSSNWATRSRAADAPWSVW